MFREKEREALGYIINILQKHEDVMDIFGIKIKKINALRNIEGVRAEISC